MPLATHHTKRPFWNIDPKQKHIYTLNHPKNPWALQKPRARTSSAPSSPLPRPSQVKLAVCAGALASSDDGAWVCFANKAALHVAGTAEHRGAPRSIALGGSRLAVRAWRFALGRGAERVCFGVILVKGFADSEESDTCPCVLHLLCFGWTSQDASHLLFISLVHLQETGHIDVFTC